MNPQQTVNIEIGDTEWEGIYSNFVIITHSNAEFIIDFARMLPGAKKVKVFSRILMTPQSAKALLSTLENNPIHDTRLGTIMRWHVVISWTAIFCRPLNIFRKRFNSQWIPYGL